MTTMAFAPTCKPGSSRSRRSYAVAVLTALASGIQASPPHRTPSTSIGRVPTAFASVGKRREVLQGAYTACVPMAAALVQTLVMSPRAAHAASDQKINVMYVKMAGPREIQAIFRILRAEIGGESITLLRGMIQAERWQEVENMARLYDTFLRKDVLQPLAPRLGANAPKAEALADDVLQTFKGIDKAAKRGDKDKALELSTRIETLVEEYTKLAPMADLREAEAAKLGLPAAG